MTFKELRESTDMNMKQFASFFNIPYRTIQDWEYEKRKCPDYVTELMQYKLEKEGKIKND